MFQLWRLEPRLCIKFITDNIYLKELPASEKVCLSIRKNNLDLCLDSFIFKFPIIFSCR